MTEIVSIEGPTVTWNPPTESVWHRDATINGLDYPTRHPVPAWAEDRGESLLSSLTDAQRDQMRAVHEAAHAVGILAGGGYLHQAWIRTTPDVRAAGIGSIAGRVNGCAMRSGLDVAIMSGAGERAEDRWLHETGLWSPAVAVGVEYGAYSDRLEVLALNPTLGFDGGACDYLVVHHLADTFVAAHWDAITAVAPVLAERLELTGDEIADLAGMPNGTHSPTCTL